MILQLFSALLLGILIDKLRLHLRIHDPLAVIESVIPGLHIADRQGQKQVRCPLKAKHLQSDQQRGNGPKVAPTKKVGTISPPLNPPAKVTAVNRILSRKAAHMTFPSMACSMICIPEPR